MKYSKPEAKRAAIRGLMSPISKIADTVSQQ